MAGDFFGEMALLSDEPRTATCRAVTPTSLHKLTKDDLDAALARCPNMRAALETAARERRKQQAA